ncbi:MAG: hypothetical protein HY905_15330 [Deltaproteobacteria bacterium]|nr:hypothetical protein [Deltaproteobacteria bacterium]
MHFADIAATWALYKTQIIVGLVVVVAAFVLLKTMVKLVKFALLLGIGGGIGVGSAYGLTRLGVQGQHAYWGAVGITLAVLLLGSLRRRKK